MSRHLDPAPLSFDQPIGVAYSAGTGRIFVVKNSTRRTLVFDADTLSLIKELPVGNLFAAVNEAAGMVYVTEGGDIHPDKSTLPGKVHFLQELIPVRIDLKPGDGQNVVNLKSQGKLPVAILTAGGFDAADVDAAAVRFGKTGTEAAPTQSAREDVDGDGDLDLILHFNTQSAGLTSDTVRVILTGKTRNGMPFKGGGYDQGQMNRL